MTTPGRTSLATGCLALLLVAGCSDDTGGGDAASTQAPGAATATPTADASPSPTAQDGPVTFSTLTGEATRLSLDDGVVSALDAVGVQLSAVGGAQQETTGGAATFVFPVTGGEATVDPSAGSFSGTVEHQGGLQLSALGRNVTIDQLVLDGGQGQLTAVVAGRRVPLLPLATDPQVTADGEQAVVTYSPVSLDTSAVESVTGQLGLPALPDLRVNALEATLTGS